MMYNIQYDHQQAWQANYALFKKASTGIRTSWRK